MRGRSRIRGVTLAELLITAIILGILAPPTVLAIGFARDSARGASNRAVARGLALRNVETFRALARAGFAVSGSTSTDYTVVGAPPMRVTNTVTVTNVGIYRLATVETVATWSEMRAGSSVPASLALGTSLRAGPSS